MARPSYSPSFEEDLKSSAAFIAFDKPDAARKWVHRIRTKCKLLAKYPQLGDAHEEFGRGVRSSYLGHYIIFFRVKGEFVEIMRVMRGDRDIKFL